MFRTVLSLALLLPAAVCAQTPTGARPAIAETSEDDRWILGLGVSVVDSPYAGEGTRTRPLPYVTYEGERFFWRADTLGVNLLRTDRFALDAIVSGRLDGVDRDDLGRAELAANGVDIDRLVDRDDGADAGLAAGWRFGRNTLALRAVADVTGTSDGYELALDYTHRLSIGRTTIIPGIGVRWLSEDLADYYYGVRSTETFSGAAYQADSALVPAASVVFQRPLVGKWRMIGRLQYQHLPDELTDSPLLERDTSGVAHAFIAVARGF
ncbi:MipA/OmpV family protein [Luteimonas kalidii]|uniref:MipA/OmpV family protein n=1 Tax=Luteimonas kalidii TaxID=3042025 RepID=A0ABT6JQ45_9GAMM|nr:MipA/OmpV family protein [Luteimonas kalidii]MDH5832811.1 MipA/OmpV family protein [Luteimonas kalidii]